MKSEVLQSYGLDVKALSPLLLQWWWPMKLRVAGIPDQGWGYASLHASSRRYLPESVVPTGQ